jgi:hypothetical protein
VHKPKQIKPEKLVAKLVASCSIQKNMKIEEKHKPLKAIRGSDGRFMRDWRTKMIRDMAAASRANIERYTKKAARAEKGAE